MLRFDPHQHNLANEARERAKDRDHFTFVMMIMMAIIAILLSFATFLVLIGDENDALKDARGYFKACRDLRYDPDFCVEITRKVHGISFTPAGDLVENSKTKPVD